jgi:hypothetical protein
VLTDGAFREQIEVEALTLIREVRAVGHNQLPHLSRCQRGEIGRTLAPGDEAAKLHDRFETETKLVRSVDCHYQPS